MSTRIYKPDTNSRVYFYIFLFSSVIVGWAVYAYTRPLVVESACSEVSQKTTGLTDSFKYDPLSDYDYSKAKCLEDVLSAEDK